MIDYSTLIVPKDEVAVTLWVHPEGRIEGTVFVRLDEEGEPEEEPIDVFNEQRPFLVLRRREPDEIRFYNRSAIVRAEYPDRARLEPNEVIRHPCRLQMMDGAMFEGVISRDLPPDFSRLSDYLSRPQELFLEIRCEPGHVYLVNKRYIVYVRPIE